MKSWIKSEAVKTTIKIWWLPTVLTILLVAQTTLFNTAAAMFSIGVRWREGMAAGGHLKIYKKEGAKS